MRATSAPRERLWGVARKTLYDKLARYRIEPGAFRRNDGGEPR